MESDAELRAQARILSRYLINELPGKRVEMLYVTAIRASQPVESTNPLLVKFGFTHPKLLPMLDSGLALTHSNSELRRRIYLMFAILETVPTYADFYLAKRASLVGAWLRIIFFGARAVLRGIGGVLLLQMLKMKAWK